MISGVEVDGQVRDLDAAEVLALLDAMDESEVHAFFDACSDDEAAELNAVAQERQEDPTPESMKEFAQAEHIAATQDAFMFGLDELERGLGRKLTHRERVGIETHASRQATATMGLPDVELAFSRYYEDRRELPYVAPTGSYEKGTQRGGDEWMLERANDLNARAAAEVEQDDEPERVPMPDFPSGAAGDEERDRWMVMRIAELEAENEPEEVEAA
jgi:hypothetical protein